MKQSHSSSRKPLFVLTAILFTVVTLIAISTDNFTHLFETAEDESFPTEFVPDATGTYIFPSRPYECGVSINLAKWNRQSPNPVEFALIQSNIFFRHGDRFFYSNRKCFDNVDWSCNETSTVFPSVLGRGSQTQYQFQKTNTPGGQGHNGNCRSYQVTFQGFEQISKIASQMRRRYTSFYQVPQMCSSHPQKYFLQADTTERLQTSAMAFFNKFCPTNAGSPPIIPLNIEDKGGRLIKPNPYVCPKVALYKKLAIKHMTRIMAKEIFSFLGKLQSAFRFKKITKGTKSLPYAFDCALVHICHNKPIPKKITPRVFRKLSRMLSRVQRILSTYPNRMKALRVNIGPFIDSLLRQMTQAVNNRGGVDKVVSMVAGHDTGPILPLLYAFNQKTPRWTPFATLITVELFQKKSDDTFYVMVSQDGKPLKGVLGGKSDAVLYEWAAFNKAMQKFVPTSQECPGLRGGMITELDEDEVEEKDGSLWSWFRMSG